MKQLKRSEMIEARDMVKNIKPYKPGRPIEEVIRELNLDGEVIKLASNENPLGTSPLAVEAMERAVKETFLYPDDNCYKLRQLLAKRNNVDQEEIIIGNGSVEIMLLVTLAYLDHDLGAVTSEGAFIWFKIATSIAGARLIEVPMKNYAYDLPKILKAIKPSTRVVYIDNPNNPTGSMISKRAMDDFIAKLPHGILLIMDEAYHEYITDAGYPDSFRYLREGKDILILRTFSKIYGLAGARLGYGFAKKNIISNLMKLRITFNVNRISQAGGIAALDDLSHVKKGRELNDAGKKYLYEAYKKLGLPCLPTHGNFILVDFGRDSQIAFEALQRKGIITRTVKEYGFHNSLRITIGTEEQNRRLIETLEEILKRPKKITKDDIASVSLKSIGVIRSPYKAISDVQHRGEGELSEIEISPEYFEGLKDIDGFSHLLIFYWLHRSTTPAMSVKTPWDETRHGLFASRSPNRVNPIGFTVVQLVKRKKNILAVKNLDAIDGTPVLDIKPYFPDADARPNARTGWFEKSTSLLRARAYIFKTAIKLEAGKMGILGGADKHDIKAGCPVEFGGKKERWSPQQLFVGAVETCVMTTFLWLLEESGLRIASYRSTAVGKAQLRKNDFVFTAVVIRPVITINSAAASEAIRDLIVQAGEQCMISKSVNCQVVLKPVIRTAGLKP
jgi:histidinol-phosphate aminotransferase